MRKTEPQLPAADNGSLIRALLGAVLFLGLIGGCAMEALAYCDPPPAYYYPQ